MKYDFYSCFWDEKNQTPLLDEIDQTEDSYCIAKLYSLSLTENSIKESARVRYKQRFLKYEVPKEILELMDSLSLKKPYYDLETLPKSSFFLHVRFTLCKPYLSRDDEGFYIHENPVSKEKVFKVPYIRASSWKGNLRWSALKNLIDKTMKIKEEEKKWKIAFGGRTRIVKIFGNEKENREDTLFDEIFTEKMWKDDKEVSKFNQNFLDYIIGQNYVDQDGNEKGRLVCYPTFFDRISLDIINPHDRETRTGKNPITLEVVPPETEGDLYLLYVPFDKMGESEDKVKEEIREDLLIICKSVKALLTEYGMSAKRTSGYGGALIGKIEFKSELLKEYVGYNDLNELIDDLAGKNQSSAKISRRGENQ